MGLLEIWKLLPRKSNGPDQSRAHELDVKKFVNNMISTISKYHQSKISHFHSVVIFL